MRRPVVFCAILLAGSLYSGATAVNTQLRHCVEWRRTHPADREDLILGPYAPAVRKVREQVREDEGILLVSDIDPAPLPYALFPRRIWQRQTEPEALRSFMEVPPSPYPSRSPSDLPVSWRLELLRENAASGGELTRIESARGAR